MIPKAKEAKILSLNSQKISEIMKDIEKYINMNINQGNVFANVPISNDTPQEVRDNVKETLVGFGYEVKIPPLHKENQSFDDSWVNDSISIRW